MKSLWLKLLWAFDLIDNAGQPDHGKLAGFVAFWTFIALIVVGKLPSVGHTIVLFSAAFGPRMFIAFLKNRTVTATESTVRTITHRRDSAQGVDPS